MVMQGRGLRARFRTVKIALCFYRWLCHSALLTRQAPRSETCACNGVRKCALEKKNHRKVKNDTKKFRCTYCILEQDRTVKFSNTSVLAENWATAGDVWCEQDSESGSPKSEEKEVFKGVK